MTTETKIPSRNEILEFIQESPEEVTSKEIAEQFGVQDSKVRPKLYQYRTSGYLKGDSNGFTITDKGRELLASGGVEREPLTTDLDVFKDIGRSYAVPDGKLQTIAEHVFGGDAYDPQWVWDSLNMTGLGLHIVKPWTKIWLARIDRLKDAPPEIRRALAPPAASPEPGAGAGVAGEEAKPRRFIVAGNQIIPDPEGDFTFKEALQIVGMRLGVPEGGSKGENVTEVITSIVKAVGGAGKFSESEQMLIQNLINRAEGKGIEFPPEVAENLRAIAAKLTPPGGGGGPDQTLTQFQGLLNTFANVLGFASVQDLAVRLHGGGGDRTNTHSVGTLTDKDGNPISITEWLEVEEAKHKWRREDEDLDLKRENTKMMRKTLQGLPAAIRSAAEEIRQMRQAQSNGEKTEAKPTGATQPRAPYGKCSECGASVPVPPDVTPETQLICPQCGHVNFVVD